MPVLKELLKLVTVLESYRGRDRIIRLLNYGAMLMGGNGTTPTQLKWKTVAAEMSACRMILRLFDDLPMMMLNLSTGFGLKGTKSILKPLECFTSVLNQFFYPVEHIAWLKQKKILSGPHMLYLLLGLLIWGCNLVAEILKSILKLRIMKVQADKLVKQRQLDKDKNGSQDAQIKENLHKLGQERKDVILGLIQSCCDLTNAISWMPPGFLWSQKLHGSLNGLFGTTATLIMLYRNWPKAPSLG